MGHEGGVPYSLQTTFLVYINQNQVIYDLIYEDRQGSPSWLSSRHNQGYAIHNAFNESKSLISEPLP